MNITTRSLALIPALSLLLAQAAAAVQLTKEQAAWFMSQPENQQIFNSEMTADQKIEAISRLPMNKDKFGPEVQAAFLDRMAQHTDSNAAADADNADHASDPGTDNKSIMGGGASRRSIRLSGGRSVSAERRPQKKTAAVKTQKQAEGEQSEATTAEEPVIGADAPQAMGGAGIGTDRVVKAPSRNGATGNSGGGGGGGGSGASASAVTPTAKTPTGTSPAAPNPAAANQLLSVVCGPTKNVLTWKLVAKRNSNSILRNVDGASADWVCGGPNNLAPCTSLNVNTYTDTDVSPGKTYMYRQKNAPNCASNFVSCPGGKITGDSCTTGGAVVGGGSAGTGGSAGPAAPVDFECTGGNEKCICVKGNGKYNRYVDVARQATASAFPDLDRKPDGMTDEEASAKICAAYESHKNPNGATHCRPQHDEIVLEDPGAPDPRYPTVSVDVITSAGAFWGKAIAACQPGVQ